MFLIDYCWCIVFFMCLISFLANSVYFLTSSNSLFIDYLGFSRWMIISKFSQDCHQGVSQAAFSSGDSSEEESHLTQVGRIHFFVDVGLRAEFLVWAVMSACSSCRLATGPRQVGFSNVAAHFIRPAAGRCN